MYAKRQPSLHLPENYCGCAFPEQEKISNGAERMYDVPLGRSGFPSEVISGIKSDDLLLIGLIVLLSSSPQNREMVLWLVLLLFC